MAPRTPVKKKAGHPSPASSTRSTLTAYKTKVPAARRCQKCVHKPLRSQCVHTKAGRAYIAANSLPPSSPLPPGSPISTPSPAVGLLSAATTTPTPLPAAHSGFTVDPFAFAHPNFIWNGLNGVSSAALPNPSFLLPASQTSTSLPTSPEVISATSPVPSTPVPAAGSSDMTSPRAGSTRTRITANNPIHGFVEGAKQGNGHYAIIRTKELRPAQPDAREAGKRFHRGMRDLIIRVENLSKETGAWIYLAGQHVNGAKGYTNYASPRLRRDAKKELTVIQNHFNTMSSALINSRRREAVELSVALEKANKERRAAQATLAELQSALDTPDLAAVLSKDAFIAKLRALVAVSGEPLDD